MLEEEKNRAENRLMIEQTQVTVATVAVATVTVTTPVTSHTDISI